MFYQQPECLLNLAAKWVFYLNLNTIYKLENTMHGNFCCCCWEYSGCPKSNGELIYCVICQLGRNYISHIWYRNYDVMDHIKLHQQIVKDLCNNPNLEMYEGDYKEKLWNFGFITRRNWSFYEYVFDSNYLKNVFY